ncbi:hypothetical protein HF289_08895 [Acidithiobacillus ferrooxidans]|uniref:hypothetical protein n=1 Tax=Acidithiobacillus ferrooxidans TaxID=920 RepID=UPI001C0776E3|nr:hypothetical protein [Acidithiobacillus ferrooxidans]MBU2856986.1 hypothetical protein [Acidithiobacillus ferrooxidans]
MEEDKLKSARERALGFIAEHASPRRVAAAVAIGSLVSAATAFASGGAGSAATAAAASFTSSGDTAIGAIGVALISLAGIAVVYKWAKGMFFS